MAKLTRHEFVGNKLLVLLLFLTGIGVPFALIYLIEATVAIEEEVEDPNKFLDAWRSGKVANR